MKRLFIVAAAALALAACGQQAPERETEDARPVAASPAFDSGIGPGGAAGITAALPMNVEAVRAAAPSYEVAEVEDQVEGDPFTAITLSAGGEEVFRLLPTADGAHLHSIVTRSARAHGPADEVAGETAFAVAPPEQTRFCNAELVDGAPGFACSSASDGAFWRVYRLPEGAAFADTFAEIEPDLLHDATLVEMRWIAPRT